MSSHTDYPALDIPLPPTCAKREGAGGREGGSINSVGQSIYPHEFSGFAVTNSI